MCQSWRKNCEEESLLGVSLTGIMDCKLTNGKDKDIAILKDLRAIAVQTANKAFRKMLGINQSVAVTCVKPSGTVRR